MLNDYKAIGRITKEIEVKKTPQNKSVIRFTLAIDEGKDKRTQFIECQAWDGTAETIAKYVKKGDMFQISGKLKNNNYESNGVKQYSYVVEVNGFTCLPNNRKQEEPQPQPQYNQPSLGGDLQRPEERNQFSYADIKSDDLPFY